MHARGEGIPALEDNDHSEARREHDERIREWVLRGRDALPLMEFALQRLWADQSEGEMRRSSYHAMGGVKGALAQQAEAFFKELPTDEERQNVKRVLLALVRVVRPGEEGEDTRWPRTRDHFGDALWPTVRTLADARLVVTSSDDVGRETAEIVHEALIRNTTELDQLSELVQAVQGLGPVINDESLMRVVEGLMVRLKNCVSPASAAKCVSAILTAARWSDDPAFVGIVFEGLKAPMAFDGATERALQALQERFPDRASELKDLWRAADWAERTFTDLDLATPPRWLVEDRA